MAGYDLCDGVFGAAHSIEILLNSDAEVQSNAFGSQVQMFRYYEEDQFVVIKTPMQAAHLATFLNCIDRDDLFQNKRILVTLHGHGATEAHYVTAHIDAQRHVQIVDSKASDPKRFFSQNPRFKWLATIKGLFLSLRSKSETLNTLIPGRTVEYISLGTQSFFDGVSCGYHAVANLKLCKSIIQEVGPNTREELLKGQDNPVQSESSKLLKHPQYGVQVNSHFITFLKTAWQGTFMPLLSLQERDKRSFHHYFMGWPYKGSFQKTLYVLTLGFIIQPILNLLKIPTLFLPRLLAQSMHWVRDRAIDWTPKTYLFQSLRSLFMFLTYPIEGFFKATAMILGLVFAPVTSMKLSYRIHPVLGVLTGLVIVGIYTVLAGFALPALWGVLTPSAITLLKPGIVWLAKPITLLIEGIPTVAAAAGSLFLSLGGLVCVQQILEKAAFWLDRVCGWSKETRLAPEFEESSSEEKREGSSPYVHRDLQSVIDKNSKVVEKSEFQPSDTLSWKKEESMSNPLDNGVEKRLSLESI